MDEYINYEDNIFIVTSRIRLLSDIFLLDASPKLFFPKSIDEIDFINGALEILCANLAANDKLIDRNAQFHNLIETEWRFTSLINFILEGKGCFAENFLPVLDAKLNSIKNDSSLRQTKLRENISAGGEAQDAIGVVSTFEMAELLKRA